MEITSRGRLPNTLRERQVLLIGAGALGSPLAQMLVRAGVRRLVIVDDDTYQIGNATRHTLKLDALFIPKASSLANDLRSSSPHLIVTPVKAAFPDVPADHLALIRRSSIVIDCTADEAALSGLSELNWEEPDVDFISLSFGFAAHRMFSYSARGTFPILDFHRQVTPWLHREAEENQGAEFPREGIGCWNPVFPARIDDVWLFASIAVKSIENAVSDAGGKPSLLVYEQVQNDGAFVGIQQAKMPVDVNVTTNQVKESIK